MGNDACVGDEPEATIGDEWGLDVEPELRARMMQRFLAPPDEGLTDHRRELRRLADAVRRTIASMVRTTAPVDELAALADEATLVAEHIERYPHGTMYEGIAEAANAGPDPHAGFDHSPFIGRSNPLAPPMQLRVDDDGTVRGTVRFDGPYEGPPGCVHGGFVAAVFDELLGAAQSSSGPPGMTGTLTIVYRSPTPLHTDLTLEGVTIRRDGRKIFTRGTLHAGEVLCAEAEGIFISIDLSRWKELKEAREADQRGDAG